MKRSMMMTGSARIYLCLEEKVPCNVLLVTVL